MIDRVSTDHKSNIRMYLKKILRNVLLKLTKIVHHSRVKQIYLMYLVLFLLIIVMYKLERMEIVDRKNYGSLSKIEYKYLNTFIDNYIEMSERDIDFKKDVLAFIHIQKTSGQNFEAKIYSNLMIIAENNSGLEEACEASQSGPRIRKCYQNRHGKPFIWNKSDARYCDIHADYTELKNCIMYEYHNRIKVPGHRLSFYGIIHFITMLREPIQRYISEYHHVKRGATWRQSVRVCNEEMLYLKSCNNNQISWTDVTWPAFLSCEYNLANNRQTRMLANYNQLGCRVLKCLTKEGNCSNEQKRISERMLLESAKQTLLSISFFGLAEYQSLSQYLFEKTFKGKMIFSQKLTNSNNTSYKITDEYKDIDLIKRNNNLDIELYEFAMDLFFKRIKYFKEKS